MKKNVRPVPINKGSEEARQWIVGTLLVVACVLCGVPSLAAQQDAAKVDIQRLGPRVGERAPDFQLQDQFGRTWTRDSIMGPKGAMLVFFRSADW